MPIELEPPPTQAITRDGQLALGGERLLAGLARRSLVWRSRTRAGNGAGPTAEPIT